MHSTPNQRHEFVFYTCQTAGPGCLIVGAMWLAMNSEPVAAKEWGERL